MEEGIVERCVNFEKGTDKVILKFEEMKSVSRI